MQPTYAIFDAAMLALAADGTTLAPAASANKTKLAKAPFTPAQGLDLLSLVEADFGGYAALLGSTGPQLTGIDPLTLERLVELKEPLGGWRWTVTASTNIPQTVYGFYVVNNAGTALYGSALFPTPLQLTGVGQVVEIDKLIFRLLLNGIM